MRLSASAPVTWPDRADLDRWWVPALADLTESRAAPDGVLTFPGQAPGDVTVRLVAGRHLAPGASYVVDDASLGAVRLAAEVAGTPERRALLVIMSGTRGLLGRSGPLVEAHVAGLDGFDRITLTSSHPYLSGTAHASPDPASPFDLDLSLRWLRVRMSARVVAGAVPTLSADVELSARGLWAPATAPLLAILGRAAREGLQPSVDDWARTLTSMAAGEGPPPRTHTTPDHDVPPPPSREDLQEARWTLAQARERWNTVQTEVEARGWWGSRRRAWLTAYDALPPVSWPARDPGDTPWAEVVQACAERIAGAQRHRRRAMIQQQVEWFGTPELAFRQAMSTESLEPRALTEEDLELRWLRSPWSTWSYLRRTGAVSEDPPPEPVEPA